MNSFELNFYEAGIKDAHKAGHIVFPCQSNSYEKLLKDFNVLIGDKRGNAAKAYNAGVAFEINRQTKLEF